jgi:Rrf2 family nitric oxide-sensitive transcriptional repressor
MRLTTFTDYTLRVLIYLAAHPGRRATIAEVSQAFHVSENHVAKVVHFLGAAGWLDNSRGRKGGMRLAVSPVEINVGEVVKLAEGSDVPAECFQPGSEICRISRGCRLKGVLAQAVNAFYESLAQHTLEDLVQGPEEIRAMLFSPDARPLAAATGSASR